jgi:hypothetical protein
MKKTKTTIQTLAKCNSGSKYAASIGGGKNNNHPSTINIYGGTVNATGGEYGAGIGGGQNRGGWNTNTLHFKKAGTPSTGAVSLPSPRSVAYI